MVVVRAVYDLEITIHVGCSLHPWGLSDGEVRTGKSVREEVAGKSYGIIKGNMRKTNHRCGCEMDKNGGKGSHEQ